LSICDSNMRPAQHNLTNLVAGAQVVTQLDVTLVALGAGVGTLQERARSNAKI